MAFLKIELAFIIKVLTPIYSKLKNTIQLLAYAKNHLSFKKKLTTTIQ
jgi:hypothetical protein